MAWEPRPQFWGEAAQARPTIVILSLSLLLHLPPSRTWYRYLIYPYYLVNDIYFDDEPPAGSRQPSASSSSTCPWPEGLSSLVPYCPGPGQAVLFNTLPALDITEKVIYIYHALYRHLGPFGPSTN